MYLITVALLLSYFGLLFFFFFVSKIHGMIFLANGEFFSVAEIEAQEACKWLRAAGFPQYAQMYEGKSN